MSPRVGGPNPFTGLESLARPFSEEVGCLRDSEQVTRPDLGSDRVDGRSVDAEWTSIQNLQAMGRTLKEAVQPDKTLQTTLNTLNGRRGMLAAVSGFLEGLALDAWDAVKAPFVFAKDGLEAVAWGGVAASEILHEEPSSPPVRPATPPPDFQEVSVRGKDRGRSGYFHYALKDGRIWSRWDPVLPKESFSFPCGHPMTPQEGQAMVEDGAGPYTYAYDAENNRVLVEPRPDADRLGFKMIAGRLQEVPRHEAAAWHLHDGLGGPNLPEGEHVVEIQVAGDFIEARSNTNKMYSYDPTKPDPVGWKAERGCPFGGEVHLPEGIRDWTLGEAVTIKPKRTCIKAMNPWTDVVGYYQDPAGRKGDFNFVATTGVLTGDGREIRYRDTGLPADFTRGFLTPHHGRFQGEKLASAGSTWLLYGREPDGAPGLYVRMMDYEINGACPGKRYSYKESPFDPDKVYSMAEMVEFQPLQPWERVSFPPLHGQAALTDRIDILPVGQGNLSREIRLEGCDAQGRTGFYHKRLDQEGWNFQATGQPLLGQPVQVGVADPELSTPGTVTLDYPQATWSRQLKKAPLRGIELVDFHPYQTQDQPSVIRFTLKSGKQVEVLLRTGDGYTMFNADPQEAALLGQGAGVPKVLAGTLEVPDSVLNSEDPEIRDFAQRHLEKLHHRENQVMVLADRDRLRLVSGWYHRNSDKGLDWNPNARWDVTFTRDARGETPFEKVALAPELRPEPGMTREELQGLLERNRATEARLTTDLKARKKEHRLKWLRAQGIELAIRGISLAGSALNLTRVIRYAAPVTQLMPPLMDAHEKAQWAAAWSTPQGHTRAVEVLQENQARARELLAS
jgi:hypothetical protein